MKDIVLIKSFPNGITLHLDAEVPFEDLLAEIAYKFSEARNFFGKATVALSIEGREMNSTDEIRILDAIHSNSNLKVICIVGKDDATNKNYIKALAHLDKKMSGGNEGNFFKGDLKNREILETDRSIIVLGDVYPGCAVVSAKNIIILGGLYGDAYAGGDVEDGAFVAALEMAPERLKIGNLRYKPSKQPKWGIRPKIQPKIAYVKDDKIILETLTKDLLSTF